MANEVDYVAFATGVGANVESQAAYVADPGTILGVQAGQAVSAKANKAWRQSSVIAAMIANFVANNANVNVLDDGNIAALLANYEASLKGWLYSGVVPVARTRLTASTNYYVGGAGASDSNPGTSSAPWATLQQAANWLTGQVDIAGQLVTINCTGAFTAGCAVNAPFIGSFGPQWVVFNFAPGSSVTATNSPCFYGAASSQYTIQGPVTLSAPGLSGTAAGYAVTAVGGATIVVGSGVSFGACASAHMAGNVVIIGPAYTIAGSSPAHLSAIYNTIISYAPEPFGSVITVTLSGTPAFSLGFAVAQHGTISCASSQVGFVGSATGLRYAGTYQSLIATLGGGASFFPGNSPGTTDVTSSYI